MRPADFDPDVVVVLGAALYPDGRPSPALERRARHGARLVLAGRAPALLLSGGPTRRRGAAHPPPIPESRAMRAIAEAEGVPPARIVEEERSTRTLENATGVRAVMAARGWQRALVVTDATHMPRALMTLRAAGVACAGAAVPLRAGGGLGALLSAAIYEAIALPWYRLRIARGALRGEMGEKTR